jgi:hypothetical protein
MARVSMPPFAVVKRWENDPYRRMKLEIESLLVTIDQDFAKLQKSGTALEYRVVASKQAAQARRLLSTLRACEASRYGDDII